MRFAYADPPYIGCAKRYKEKTEVDHVDLINHLDDKYDAWALSCHTPSLQYLLSVCPKDVRVAAWVKPFCVFKPNVNPAYAWEPVIFKGARKRGRDVPTVRDWVSANITLRKGLVGAKPESFCFWLFELMGLLENDEIDDLYPGTDIVTNSWQKYILEQRKNA